MNRLADLHDYGCALCFGAMLPVDHVGGERMEIGKGARGSTNWLAVAVLALATLCIRVEHAHAQATVLQHQGAVRRIAFSPDGEVLVS